MIFKQWREIIEGKKTQTRRIVHPEDRSTATFEGIFNVWRGNYRSRFNTHDTYAVVPKRGERAIWWQRDEIGLNTCDAYGITDWRFGWRYNEVGIPTDWLKTKGFQQLRIHICSIRCEHLQVITEADAHAEGVESVAAYRDLWQSINGKTKGARWEDNPLVWVLTFEVVRP